MPELDLGPRALWRRGSLAHDGLRLAYASAGKGRVAVFLSGGPGDGPGYLSPLADRVGAPGWCRVLLHQRGTGRSPVRPGTSLTVEDAVGDVAVLAGHLGARRLVLVGHGYGATLALLAAGWYPYLVAGVVLFGLGPLDGRAADLPRVEGYLDGAGRAALRAALAHRDAALVSAEGTSEESLRAALVDLARLRAPACVRSPAVRAAWLRELCEELDHDPWTHRELATSLAKVDQRPVVGAVRCPVHVIHGRHDAEPLDNVSALAALAPQTRVIVVEDAAHLPWLDQPGAVAAALDAALGWMPDPL